MYHQQRWTLKKLKQRLRLVEGLVYRRADPLPPFRYQRLPDEALTPLVQAEVDDSAWPTIEPGRYWGKWRTTFVLRTSFRVPDTWSDAPVALDLPLGETSDFSHPEALIYVDGDAYAACDRHHQEVLLRDEWRGGEWHTLALHGWTGNGQGKHAQLLMRPCRLVQVDPATRDFVAAARVALGVAEALGDGHAAYAPLLNALDAAFHALDTRDPLGDAFYGSVPPALAVLRQGIATAGAPLDATITAVGHAHIDVAWLWTLAQTRRKAGRTFHTVLRLMEQFPDYHFTQSQPQLYDYVRQDYPALFEAIKAQVQAGRWEAIGGMWVEADCNLSGGEALARQFLLGRSFFRTHFGPEAESPVLWLPDVFGYAWNLPQLMKQAGLDYFFTIKIGWSQYNKMPHDTFWWQGLDGSHVLTHFSPIAPPEDRAATYNAAATPAEVVEGWRRFPQKESSRHLLMAYGYGDGGGGPTREMQENIREMARFPGAPQLRAGKALDFFRAIEQEADARLPVWRGELYLEYHLGTYTTQARTKRANRQSEFLLHDAEFVAAVAAQVTLDFAYPHAELRRAWELLCLNQFHDIIPGSSIHEVYQDAAADYAEIRRLGEAARDEALRILARAMGSAVLLVNPTSFAQRGPILWAGGTTEQVPSGLTVQPVADGVLLEVAELPPYSVQPLDAVGAAALPGALSVSPRHLENDFLRVELTPEGDISRLFDKQHQREILLPGQLANQWLAFEDRPMAWDAWDIDIFYDDKHWLAAPADAVRVVEQGPLRATIEIERRILNSTYVQRLSLCHHSPRLDIATTIEWRERHILLKVAFPVDVLTPTATYEIQWGNVERPIHRNTSWDWAKFETCGHKWVDVSEGNYGVSLLNDCKYGYDIQDASPDGCVMRLSLLRGSTYPDSEADQGEHRFTYSLLPHAGRWNEQTIAHAYALNDPVQCFALASASPTSLGGAIRRAPMPFVSVDRPNVIVETVKQAEDGDGVIVRLYESQRQRGTVTLRTSLTLSAVWRTTLLEENEAELEHDGSTVTLPLKPYQIMTLRLRGSA